VFLPLDFLPLPFLLFTPQPRPPLDRSVRDGDQSRASEARCWAGVVEQWRGESVGAERRRAALPSRLHPPPAGFRARATRSNRRTSALRARRRRARVSGPRIRALFRPNEKRRGPEEEGGEGEGPRRRRRRRHRHPFPSSLLTDRKAHLVLLRHPNHNHTTHRTTSQKPSVAARVAAFAAAAVISAAPMAAFADEAGVRAVLCEFDFWGGGVVARDGGGGTIRGRGGSAHSRESWSKTRQRERASPGN